MAALLRYPTVTRTCFIECAGNSSRALTPQPLQIPAGALHGMVSCSEWTGIPLAVLLHEAGVESSARWLLAEGADASGLSRSIPLEKAFDDVMIALYQNGERLRPEQGYPMRLLLPGWEGNMNVKWLRRLKLTDGPIYTKDETSRYTEPLPNGKARQFNFEMGVKSVITRPSSGMNLADRGFHEISGIAWSGAGRIRTVEVSADGGSSSWQAASLQGEHLAKSLVRFRAPWYWDGTPALLQSRATDEKGNTQPTRSAFISAYAPDNQFHNNAIITWQQQVNADWGVQECLRLSAGPWACCAGSFAEFVCDVHDGGSPSAGTAALGRLATADEIASWDVSIPPSGAGLPEGSGTARQGASVYQAKCAACHGDKGAGQPADALVGGIGSLATAKPLRTVGSYWPYATTLFDYVRRAMPLNNPMSLSDDDVYAVSAWILYQNGIVPEDAPMTASTLPKVEMPNRDGFIDEWPARVR